MLNDFTVRLQHSLGMHYVLEREIGRGGMATVYQAKDLRHGRKVAIKAFAADVGSENAAARFKQEIRIVASLSHPHIIPLIDSDKAEGVAWFAMPLAEGESLRDRLSRQKQIPVDEAVQVTLDVASALEYAHQHGVVHRDIKPENILLQEGHALVSDFGVARTLEVQGGSRLTEVGVGVGTPEYMSPEQLSGGEVDARADQYALALVLYEMLAGNQAFAASTPHGVLARKLKGELLAVATVRPSVVPALDDVLRRALAPAPVDRFPTVEAFANAIRTALATAGAPPVRRHVTRRQLAAAAAVAVVVIGGAALLLPRLRARHLDASLVAVFPFRAATTDAAEWAEGLPDLLSTALDGTPGMRVADPWSLWRGLRPAQDAPARSPDPLNAGILARERGAARYVLGSVRRDGVRLAVTVRVYLTAVSDSVEQTLSESAPEDSLTGLADRLAVAIMSRAGERGATRSAPNVERYTTRSPEAMKAYLAARGALRRGLVDSANRSIDRALARDSNFALALAEAPVIKSWYQFLRGVPYSGLSELVARGLRFGDSLSLRNRLRLQLMDASIRTEGPRAAEIGARLVELDSSDFDAWNVVSYVRMVYGWQYGSKERDLLDAEERTLKLDSTNAQALARRAWHSVASGDSADQRRQLRRLRAVDTVSGLLTGFHLGLELLLARDADVDGVIARVVASPTPTWVSVYRLARGARMDRVQRLADTLMRRATPGDATRLATNLAATLKLNAGSHEQLAAMLDGPAFATIGDDRRRYHTGLVAAALIGLSPADPGTGRAVEQLTRYVPLDSALALFQKREVWNTGWLLAAYHASVGDTMVARRWRTVIGSFPTTGSDMPEYPHALQADIDARLAARRGDLAAALTHVSRALHLWTDHTENVPEFNPEPQMRFLAARLLRVGGRPDSAAALFRSLTPPTTWLSGLTPLAWTELGEIAAEQRDCARAIPLFQSVLRLLDSTATTVTKVRERAETGRRKCAPAR